LSKPDIIRLSINITRICNIVAEAQKTVNRIIKKVMSLLSDSKIEKDWIQTAGISFQPEYTWKNNSYMLQGQKVEQEIICIVPNIIENIDNVKYLLDNITKISNSIKCKLIFGFSNYEAKMAEARVLAYANAHSKAKVYAELADLKILKAMKISEFEPSEISADYGNSSEISITGNKHDNTSTDVPIGDIRISGATAQTVRE
jgi:uncharacterized protein YggE